MGILDSLSDVMDSGFGSVDEVGSPGDLAGWIDTGSYAFNALCSGSIYDGLPSNKITVLAGEPSVGKTFYMLEGLKGHLQNHPDNQGIIFDSESAITSDMLRSHGVDTSRVSIKPVATIEEWRTLSSKILTAYEKKYAKTGFDEPRLFLALDSLGNLSSNKEVEDIQSGDDKRDMTKAQLIRGAMRVLTIKCGKTNTPYVITNHVYDGIGGNSNEKTASGGKGPMYSASLVIFFSKSQHKEGDEVVGARIRCTVKKSRFTRERQFVFTLLDFEKGLDRHYGLLDLAEAGGVIEKISTRYLINGKKVFGKTINNNPKDHWTPELLDQINEYTQKRFKFGSEHMTAIEPPPDEEVEAEDKE